MYQTAFTCARAIGKLWSQSFSNYSFSIFYFLFSFRYENRIISRKLITFSLKPKKLWTFGFTLIWSSDFNFGFTLDILHRPNLKSIWFHETSLWFHLPSLKFMSEWTGVTNEEAGCRSLMMLNTTGRHPKKWLKLKQSPLSKEIHKIMIR